MEKIAEFLQSYGGWGVAVVLGFALYKFYGDFKTTIKEKDDLIQSMNETHSREMVAVVRECAGILTAVQVALEKCEKRQWQRRDGDA